VTLSAPYLFEYAYRRSLGPLLDRFLTGLREGRIEGVRARDGRVLVPPAESDEHGHATGEWVAVSDQGVVVTHAPPFWALIRLDGASTALLHRTDGPVTSGMRVRARWRAERTGTIHDIECFEPVAP
jgi:uncharacterized OB-fold protein